MATRWNLYNQAATFATSIRGSWSGAQLSIVGINMGPDKATNGGSTGTCGGNTGGSPGQSSYAIIAVGPALPAQVISGTFDLCVPVSVATTAGDFHWQYVVYVLQPPNTVRGTLLGTTGDTHPGDEWDTNHVGRNCTQRTLSPVTCQAGDRIVVEMGMVRRASSGAFVDTFGFGGTGADAASGVAGVGWVEFSQDLIVIPRPPRSHAVVLG